MLRIGLALCGTLILINGCSVFRSHEDSQAETYENKSGIQIKYGPQLPPEIIHRINQGFDRLENIQLSTEPTPAFLKAFGTSDLSGVEGYLRERIHAIVLAPENSGTTEFSNISSHVFMDAQMEKFPPAHDFKVGGLSIDPFADRLGVLSVPRTLDSGDQSLFIARSLVHEARHSDCPGGVNVRNVSLKAGESERDYYIPKDLNRCFQPHSPCPSDLQGDLNHKKQDLSQACDQYPWGAYSFEYVFLREISLRCENCSALEKSDSARLALARARQLSFLPKKLRKQILIAHHGTPHQQKSALSALDSYLSSEKLPNPDLSSLGISSSQSTSHESK